MMACLARFVLSAALLAAAPALAQAPSPTTPPDKVAPDPIQPPPGPAERPAGPAAMDAIGVPAKVWAVRIAGGWEADGKRGFSRVIGTFEGDSQRLTVQWLAEPDGRVIDSKVLEDEEASKLTFGDMRAEPGERGGVTVFLDTLPDADGIRDTWVLILGGPGEARFGPAMN
jgi:hypothetical protein